MFTGQPIDARRALEIGMVHQVVAADELEAATSQLAQTIARNAPLALAGIKATIQRAISLRTSIAHADLDEVSGRARQSSDASEGRRAMLEKRRPVFRGE
jgi:enoyl-CoA hydratase/carnithine racemase